MQCFRNCKTGKHHGCFGFCFPAVQFCKFAFEFRSANTVCFGKVNFSVKSVFFFHDLVEAFISHQNSFKNGEFVIGIVILF
ncbi:hypothetical protein D3C86_1782990 [compost metagenome]